MTTMNPNARRPTASAAAVLALSATLLAAPVQAHRPSPSGTGAPVRGAQPAVYVVGDRVVAIRRDPLPAGAYGGHGVDYSPELAAYVLGPSCGVGR